MPWNVAVLREQPVLISSKTSNIIDAWYRFGTKSYLEIQVFESFVLFVEK